MGAVRRYRSPDEDSGRWAEFRFREGDVVISARSKSGTTWMQMICALLIFRTRDLPAPLAAISPWLDWLVEPIDSVIARLGQQTHRRFVKTHTPLDGVPMDPRATYVVVGRDPLDMAVSLYHQGDNIDRKRLAELTGQPQTPTQPRPQEREWLLAWIEHDAVPLEELDSLPGVMWHLGDAWSRRAEPNVVLVHYDDLLTDLGGSMRALASRLDIQVPDASWPDLIVAAGFDEMRSAASMLAPDRVGVLKDPTAFFRRGRSGAGRELLTDRELARFRERLSSLGPPDLCGWLHRT
jgi:hypothetical protein